ncbi:checkpoint protein HUS1-like isoform X2 [Dermacentor silvarum]|uniref:checkpoint protein HUS1-like isoform X2 n=1 Tax=Dermacentor silvarum TaxID=543639 RepID=UPI002101CCBE|nr:checkpoint protein HUS1-like isoform X2 [Dermacentor silvarum]
MKFRGRIVDIVCIQQLSKIVHTVSKLAKDVTLRITTDCVYFILNEDAVSGGGWLWADIPQETLFQEYNMQGVSDEFNEIYLDVVADHIVKALKSAAAAKSLKVKLTKRQTPCLSFEIELPSLVSTSRTVVHDVPVSVIPRRLWNNFAQPDVEEGDTITISSDHGMTVSVQTDMVTVTTHFKGLQFPLSGDGTISHAGVYEARIDLRKLVPVLLAQQLNPRQVTCKIAHKKLCHITFNHDYGSLQYLLPCVYS